MTATPNFFIVGVPKAATTTLYAGLQQHPQVFTSPRKEPHYLALNGARFISIDGYVNHIRTIRTHPLPVHREQNYRALFEDVEDEPAVGEASTLYLYGKLTPERIAERYPKARVIAILRHPVDRAYSQFLHHVRDTHEWTDDFEEAFRREEVRLDRGPFWHYRRMGYYHRQLLRYYERMDSAQIRVFLFEDLVTDLPTVYRHVYRFIGVDETFEPELVGRSNVTGVPRNKLLHEVLSLPWRFPALREIVRRIPKPIRRFVSSIRGRNLEKPVLDPEIRRRLTAEYYEEDLSRLQELLGRDLHSWIDGESVSRTNQGSV